MQLIHLQMKGIISEGNYYRNKNVLLKIIWYTFKNLVGLGRSGKTFGIF